MVERHLECGMGPVPGEGWDDGLDAGVPVV